MSVCVASVLYGLEWPEDAEEAYELCPGEACLRSFGCLVVRFFFFGVFWCKCYKYHII